MAEITKTHLFSMLVLFWNGWCYFPSIRTKIKCNYSLFSVCMDGNLYAYIRYFSSVYICV